MKKLRSTILHRLKYLFPARLDLQELPEQLAILAILAIPVLLAIPAIPVILALPALPATEWLSPARLALPVQLATLARPVQQVLKAPKVRPAATPS
ncbi:MAG: hypothetical protein ABI575_06410 [Oxalobacteraceae bacterium]